MCLKLSSEREGGVLSEGGEQEEEDSSRDGASRRAQAHRLRPALPKPSRAMSEIRRKLVIVGDGACGKTCLLIVFSKGTFPEVRIFTADPRCGRGESVAIAAREYNTRVADVVVDGKRVELALWDTAGQEDYDRLRPLSYPDSHVILICFAVDSPDSLDNVQEKWISEVLHFCSGLPIILVGCKKDLRNDPKTIDELRRTGQRPVTPQEGEMVRQKIGATRYLECSARTGEGVREVFETATRLALLSSKGRKKSGNTMADIFGLRGERYAFLRLAPPPSYVAGAGRGAQGFTTRSDIGPAREQVQEDEGPKEEEYNPDQFQDPENETGLFAGTVYEADDEEADRIYEAVDAKIDERRRARREQREREEAEQLLKDRPTIQSQFADLKRGLADMSEDDWYNLPEVSNMIGNRVKKPRLEGRSYVVPDSVIVGNRDKGALESALAEEQMKDGFQTPADALTDFAEIGQAREKMLSIKLEQAGTDSALGSTNIDPKGYLTGLDSQLLKTSSEIGDIKRARALLQSLTKTNPKHAPGWVAAAWLENVAGKQVAARKIIAEGCEQCPKNEDVWLCASELNTNENAKIILANAVQELPQSVRIWMRAVELEHDVKAKKRVLRKALEYIPASVKLWKETVELEENPDDARILLARAVEVIPHSQELWLALARLETPERARAVLNKARKAIPTSHEIWIAAGRLQEQEGNVAQVDAIIATGVASLKKNQAELSREQWLAEAERAEQQGSTVTAQAIVKATIHLDVDEEDRQAVWMDDAETMTNKGMIATARAIYAYALNVFPQKQSIWRKAADLEKHHGERETLLALLNRAVESVPQAEVLWLMAAKESWLSGDVDGARQILSRAFEANPDSEGIWLAAVKLEAENGQIEAAKQLMQRAREVSGTQRIWVKSAVFERTHSDNTAALQMVKDGLKVYPASAKLHMMQAQLLQAQTPPNLAAAREALAAGVRKCPTSVPLWIMASRLEEQAGVRIKARALLEKARNVNPKSDELWLESVKVEERDGSGAAKAMLARALQTLPASGLLHSYSVWQEPRPTRKTRSVDALKKTNNAPAVIVTVARLFWGERKVEKARDWFGRAVAADGDYGDAWAWWWKFEKQHGTDEHRQLVLEKCIAADPHHGHVWPAIAKDPKNVGKDIKAVLDLTADALEG
ncbi:Pre-mRNA-splicing factor prp1 [Rhodotorula toruloides]|nr:Pre-mRNA-splicing factor prp1 [Rhodotorula toruloides]